MQPNKMDYLMHYASKYYDPVKAHQYYEDHKELVGRKNSSLNDEGKKVWNYTKQNIKAEKKQKLVETSSNYQQKVAALRETAQRQREEISSNLKDRLMAISDESERKKAALSVISTLEQAKVYEQSKSKLQSATKEGELRTEQIQNALKTATTDEQKEQLRNKLIKIKSDEATTKNKISEDTKEDKQKVKDYIINERQNISQETAIAKNEARAESSVNRENVKQSLSSSLSEARKALANKKEEINNIYEKLFDSEFDKIASEYGGRSGKNYDEIYRKAKEARKNKK